MLPPYNGATRRCCIFCKIWCIIRSRGSAFQEILTEVVFRWPDCLQANSFISTFIISGICTSWAPAWSSEAVKWEIIEFAPWNCTRWILIVSAEVHQFVEFASWHLVQCILQDDYQRSSSQSECGCFAPSSNSLPLRIKASVKWAYLQLSFIWRPGSQPFGSLCTCTLIFKPCTATNSMINGPQKILARRLNIICDGIC